VLLQEYKTTRSHQDDCLDDSKRNI